jgi:predicted flavoprotein YhiN
MKTGRDHAIVVGASMAGMLAARVLADTFERVTVLERDALPDGPNRALACRRRGSVTRCCHAEDEFWNDTFLESLRSC